MQIRQVRSARRDGGELQIELHPALTILTGLGEEGRETVGDLLAAVIYGEVADLAGSLDLEGRSVPLQDWCEVVGDQLNDFDVFIRSEDLPGGDERRGWTEELRQARDDARLAEQALTLAELDLVACREARIAADAAASARAREAAAAAERLAAAEGTERAAKAAVAAATKRRTAAQRARAAADKRLGQVAAEREVLAAEVAAGQSVVEAAEAAAAEAQRLGGVARAAQDGARRASRVADEAVQRQAERDRVTEELEARRAEAERRVEVARHASDTAAAATGEAEGALATAVRTLEAARKHEREAAAAKARARADLPAKRAAVDRLQHELAAALAEDQAEAGLDVGGASAGPSARGGPSGRRHLRSRARASGAVKTGADGRGDTGHEEVRAAEAELAEQRAEASRLRQRWTEAAQRRDSLDARRSELRSQLEQLAARAGPAGVPTPDEVERVAAQADELRALAVAGDATTAAELVGGVDALIAEQGRLGGGAAPKWLVESAIADLEAADQAVAEARARIEQTTFTPGDAADLEVAHAVVADAEAAAGRRIGGAAARRRLEAAQATEAEILERMGFASYSAYLLRTIPVDAAATARAQLHAAERALADAEAVWAEVQQADLTEDRAELDARQAATLSAVAALLGSDASTLEAARAGLVELVESSTRRQELVASLTAATRTAAVDDPAAVLDAADAWLLAAREASEHDEAVDAGRGAAEQELASVESALDALPGADVEQAAAEAEAAVAQAEQDIVMLRSRLAAEAVRHRVAAIEEELRVARGELERTAEAANAKTTGEQTAGESGRTEQQVAGLRAQADEARATAASRAAELRTLSAELTTATRAVKLGAKPGRSGRGTARPSDPELARAEADRLAALAQVATAEADQAARTAADDAAAAERVRGVGTRLAARLSAADEAISRHGDALQAAEQALADAETARAAAEAELVSARDARWALAEADGTGGEGAAGERERGRRAASATRPDDDIVGVAAAEEEAAIRAVELAGPKASEAADELARVEGRVSMQRLVEPPVPVSAEDAEIYLLARMARARSVEDLGSVPLVLVDPLVGVDAEERAPVLDLLARISPAVQVLFLTDDQGVVDWAERLGRAQASVVRFGPALATA